MTRSSSGSSSATTRLVGGVAGLLLVCLSGLTVTTALNVQSSARGQAETYADHPAARTADRDAEFVDSARSDETGRFLTHWYRATFRV